MKVHEAEWFKSSHSNGNGNCVEVAYLSDAVAMRDSKETAGPILHSTYEGWHVFVGSVAEGRM
ncbi:DUF397 domain-containing protein [Streptomyces sp. DSM 41982]|uniref:DUF397 domain-containing protein n=1 Tax=Streptomyces evansiae TaxID=3075535 RepID=A0ABD5EEN2_9ACTN|nr:MULTISPECIES: DUF397 domain-containing protein [unclassified Streptomyces]MDT0419630.1 DUF397 domain-containing protein [Streptomyces sp. DSM 41982]SCE12845.1 protein of unknown function [Streptomyces sp. SolWspMP-sol7th]